MDTPSEKKRTSLAQRCRALANRLGRKGITTIAVVAVVLVVAGCGFTVWHSQPSFCNAICHEPMDSYVEGFANQDTKMAAAHVSAGLSCLDCHEPTISEQATEALSWISGSYSNPMEASNLANQKGFCLRSGCHSQENWEAAHNDVDLSLGNGCASCHVMHRNHEKWGATGLGLELQALGE